MYRTSARPLREAAKRYPIRARWRLLRLRLYLRRPALRDRYPITDHDYPCWVRWPFARWIGKNGGRWPCSGMPGAWRALPDPVRPPPRGPSPKGPVL